MNAENLTIFLSLKNELSNNVLLNIFKYEIYCNTDIKKNILPSKNSMINQFRKIISLN